MNCDLTEYGLELPVLKLGRRMWAARGTDPLLRQCPPGTGGRALSLADGGGLLECGGMYSRYLRHALTGDTPSAIPRKEAEQLGGGLRKVRDPYRQYLREISGRGVPFRDGKERNRNIRLDRNEPDRIRQLLDLGIRNITTRNLKEALRLRGEGA